MQSSVPWVQARALLQMSSMHPAFLSLSEFEETSMVLQATLAPFLSV